MTKTANPLSIKSTMTISNTNNVGTHNNGNATTKY